MTKPTQQNIARLAALFRGYSAAYGTYVSEIPNEAKGKLEIKATARTVRAPVTTELWSLHVAGTASLGIIPIAEGDVCWWGVIDVDNYELDYARVLDDVRKNNLPLIGCRSKSGGLHLFTFVKTAVSAAVLQARLREMAALLGFGDSEIFPKQRQVNLGSGDLGSWLNMPYFGGDETTRYGIKANGAGMTLTEFLGVAEAVRNAAPNFNTSTYYKKTKDDPVFGDGPPCMQHLTNIGFPEGTRNKGLFALGVFAKRKFPQSWEQKLEEWNHAYFTPPLPSSEVQIIIKSLQKKEYFYTCKEAPLLNHCNSALCRVRKFGVGGEDDYPIISSLSVLVTEPPLWFLSVENSDLRIELLTEELQNYRLFQRRAMERLQVAYLAMGQDAWLRVVQDAMRSVVKLDAPDEIGYTGQFYDLLEDFVLNRHRGEVVEDILSGRPWEDPDAGRHYFRLRDLQKFLEIANFKVFSRAQLIDRIRQLGGDKHFFNLRGKGINVWWVPNKFIPIPTLPTPPIAPDPV